MPLTKKAKTLRFEQIRVAIHLTEGYACDIVKNGNAQVHLVVSTFGSKPHCFGDGRLYFLLFIFTFKVGKSYENSVNHGGNTSHQTNDKINCHTYASFNLVFQLSLVEFWRQPPELWAFPTKDYTLLFVWCKDCESVAVGRFNRLT